MQVLYMKNVQVTIDQATLSEVDRMAKPLGLERSDIVRAEDWLEAQGLEQALNRGDRGNSKAHPPKGPLEGAARGRAEHPGSREGGFVR